MKIDLTAQQWETQREYFDYRCGYCHEALRRDDQDHIIPISKGGDHTLENVVPVCPSCNARKKDWSLAECLMKGYL